MSAEEEFRAAFERLRSGTPRLLKRGTEISQSNVAREAGKDPSALRKSRYRHLIAEIQAWVAVHEEQRLPRASQAAQRNRRRNRSLREAAAMWKQERDYALSMLVEADTVIMQLRQEIDGLKRKLDLKS